MSVGSIVIKDLTKTYRIYDRPLDRIKEAIFGARYHQDFHALKGVSLEIPKGVCLGIVGLNGSGKSTLLQCIAGVLTPTSGIVEVNGKISALLELGAGFNGEYTGLENVRFQCAIMGYSPEETAALLPQIVEFADIGDFINHPVKTYSSGMYVRLAFSVAISVDPDILIVDEALAVGDIRFQAKCLSKIREFRAAGKTLLFVSHDAGAVKALCDVACLLDRGSLVHSGSPVDVFNLYNALIAERDVAQTKEQHGLKERSGNQNVRINKAEILNTNGLTQETFTTGDVVTVRVELASQIVADDVTVGILFRDRLGRDVFGTNTYHLGKPLKFAKVGDRVVCEFKVKLDLGPDIYTLTVAVHRGESHIEENFDWINDVVVFKVIFPVNKRFAGCAALEASVLIHD
jgi:lipopolysaccharide transport system ATP-binding protein